MVIVAAEDIMYRVATVIILDPIRAIVVHRAIMSRQNGMSVIASSRAIMVGVESVRQALLVLQVPLAKQVPLVKQAPLVQPA